jgi:hypothetical protein
MKSRKATLLRLLDQLGEYRGIDIHRTPGEEAAIAIAMQLVSETTLKKLDKVAAKADKSEPFWSKQW